VFSVGKSSKKVQQMYENIICGNGSEFDILLNLSGRKLKNLCDMGICKAILNVRKGRVKLVPGYDGKSGSEK